MLKRVELVKEIAGLSANIASNIKFLTLLHSRLMEDGIPPDHAAIICGAVNFDFSNVPEDDDTLSDIATEFSSYCVKVRKQIDLSGYMKKFAMFASMFGNYRLEVDH